MPGANPAQDASLFGVANWVMSRPIIGDDHRRDRHPDAGDGAPAAAKKKQQQQQSQNSSPNPGTTSNVRKLSTTDSSLVSLRVTTPGAVI